MVVCGDLELKPLGTWKALYSSGIGLGENDWHAGVLSLVGRAEQHRLLQPHHQALLKLLYV